MKTATNPESGATSYTYNNNGTLYTKTDAKNIVTTFSYDDVNHATVKSYSSNAAPTSTYTFGTAVGACYLKGRLLSSANTVSNTGYCYDPLGRIKSSSQTDVANNVPYNFQYSYNLAGGLLTTTYPTNIVLTYAYDSSGRVQTVINGASSSTQNYASSILYAPHGATKQLTYGGTGGILDRKSVV